VARRPRVAGPAGPRLAWIAAGSLIAGRRVTGLAWPLRAAAARVRLCTARVPVGREAIGTAPSRRLLARILPGVRRLPRRAALLTWELLARELALELLGGRWPVAGAMGSWLRLAGRVGVRHAARPRVRVVERGRAVRSWERTRRRCRLGREPAGTGEAAAGRSVPWCRFLARKGPRRVTTRCAPRALPWIRSVSRWLAAWPGEGARVAPVPFGAAGRVDQASRREDGRRRQHVVGIVVYVAGRARPRVARLATGGPRCAGPCPGLAARSRRVRSARSPRFGSWHARTRPAGCELAARRRPGERLALHERTGRWVLAGPGRAGAGLVVAGRNRSGRWLLLS
jgi:hypothetical protein